METKVPFYSVVNIFLPGLTAVGAFVFLFLDKVTPIVESIVIGGVGFELLLTISVLAIAFEIGYIIFRAGAIVLEPLLKKMFGWVEYHKFIAAEKTSETAHEKLEMLSREYSYTRTHIVLFIVISILSSCRMQWWILCICVVCIVLFILSARGRMKQIQKVVKQYISESSD